MPAHHGWMQEAAEQLYWMIQDVCDPDLAKHFRSEIREGFVCVFCEDHAPGTVLKVVNEEFFRRYNIPLEKWEMVFSLPWAGEQWVPYRPADHAYFPGGRFGWRYRETLLVETLPTAIIAPLSRSSDVIAKAAILAEALPGNGEPPAFARKFMD